jgi:hypothetical protein
MGDIKPGVGLKELPERQVDPDKLYNKYLPDWERYQDVVTNKSNYETYLQSRNIRAPEDTYTEPGGAAAELGRRIAERSISEPAAESKPTPEQDIPEATKRPQISQGLQPFDLDAVSSTGGGWASTISPETRKLYEQSFAAEAGMLPQMHARAIQAENEAHKIRQDAYEEAQKQVAAHAGAMWGAYSQALKEEKHAREVYEAAQAEYEDAAKEVRNTKIDPGKFFRDQGAFMNILTAISVAMGGFFSVYTGQNPALDIINRAIDREIRAQELELAKKKDLADNALKKNLQLSKDWELAKERTRIQLLEAVKLSSQKVAMDQGNAEALAAHQKLEAELQNQADKSIIELGRMYAEYRARTERFVPPQAAASIETLIKESEEKGKSWIQATDPVTGEVLLQGLAQGGPGEAEKLRDKVVSIRKIISDFEQAANLRKQLDTLSTELRKVSSATKSPEYVDLERKFSELVTEINKAQYQGAISHGDAERAGTAATNFLDLKPQEVTVRAIKNAQEDWRKYLRSYQETLIPARQLVAKHKGFIHRIYLETPEPPSNWGSMPRPKTEPLIPGK